MKEYWWFSALDHKLGHGDGREAMVGVTHAVAGPIELCEKGLHASPRALDALQYASGPCAWLVGLGGSILDGGDKSCATERTYIAGGVDTTEVLRAFARRVALDVAHLWSMPDEVRAYLETGDESMRTAAWAAASAAAKAARAATWAASDEPPQPGDEIGPKIPHSAACAAWATWAAEDAVRALADAAASAAATTLPP